ncbi:hypothetical protein BHE74_00004872 [Ensete ventricosum]|nr:hypothetical protein BHE74_00004872 [Ensete ventricosum]
MEKAPEVRFSHTATPFFLQNSKRSKAAAAAEAVLRILSGPVAGDVVWSASERERVGSVKSTLLNGPDLSRVHFHCDATHLYEERATDHIATYPHMVVTVPYPPTLSLSNFLRSSALEIPKFLSHTVVVKDTSAHRLPPSIHSHSEVSTMRKKCSVAFLNSFAATLALCSVGLLHNDNNIGELCLVPNILPQREASITSRFWFFYLHSSFMATCSFVDTTVHLPGTGSLGFFSCRPCLCYPNLMQSNAFITQQLRQCRRRYKAMKGPLGEKCVKTNVNDAVATIIYVDADTVVERQLRQHQYKCKAVCGERQ